MLFRSDKDPTDEDKPSEEIKNGWSDLGDGNTGYLENSELVKGWKNIDGNWYYFLEDGKRVESDWAWVMLDNGDYSWKFFNSKGININQFFNENGKVWISTESPKTGYVKGWWTNPENGYVYYFRETSGSRVEGWQKIDGGWHYFRESSGTRALGYQYINGSWYYLKESGRVEGQWLWLEVNINGTKKNNWKYFNSEGKNIEQFFNENGSTWLSQIGPSREYARGWKSINGLIYYFRESSGTRVTGWQTIEGEKYYFRDQGTAVTGLQTINGKKYYFAENTSKPYLMTNTTVSYKGVIYELDKNGVATKKASQRWVYENGIFRRYSKGKLIDDRRVGTRFIVVDLKIQKLYMYKDGKLFIETNVITGKPLTPTITGTFSVYSKERKRMLQNKWFVEYWIPFKGGYGIHDAYWQSDSAYRDPSAYTYRGSHGCVNTPFNNVKKIYENIKVGDTVIVFD